MKTNLKTLLGTTTILTLLAPLAAFAAVHNMTVELQVQPTQHLEISNLLLGTPTFSAA